VFSDGNGRYSNHCTDAFLIKVVIGST